MAENDFKCLALLDDLLKQGTASSNLTGIDALAKGVNDYLDTIDISDIDVNKLKAFVDEALSASQNANLSDDVLLAMQRASMYIDVSDGKAAIAAYNAASDAFLATAKGPIAFFDAKAGVDIAKLKDMSQLASGTAKAASSTPAVLPAGYVFPPLDYASMSAGDLAKFLIQEKSIPLTTSWRYLSKKELLQAIDDAADPAKLLTHAHKAADAFVEKMEARVAKALSAKDAKGLALAKKNLASAEKARDGLHAQYGATPPSAAAKAGQAGTAAQSVPKPTSPPFVPHPLDKKKPVPEAPKKVTVEAAKKQVSDSAAVAPTFSPAPMNPLIKGASHKVETIRDQSGADWLFKPVSKSDAFLAHGEHAAHETARRLGLQVAPSRLVTMPSGKFGQAQRIYTEGHEMVVPSALTTAQAEQVIQHQVLDWLVSNHDAHGGNFKILADGTVAALDKGQVYKSFTVSGLPEELSTTFRLPGNVGTPYYNDFWKAFNAGSVKADLNTVNDLLLRVDAMSDAEYRALWFDYAQGNKALLDRIVARKNSTLDDFATFLEARAKDARVEYVRPGATAPVLKKAAKKTASSTGVAPRLSVSKVDEDLVKSIDANGSLGTPVFVSGTDFEYGQLLFDTYVDAAGVKRLRMTAQVRVDADGRISSAVKQGEPAEIAALRAQVPDLLPKPQLSDYSSISDPVFTKAQTDIVAAAKSVNYHIDQGDFTPNAVTMGELANSKAALELLRENAIKKFGESLAEAARDGAEEMLKMIDQIESAAAARSKLPLLNPQLPTISEEAAKKALADATEAVLLKNKEIRKTRKQLKKEIEDLLGAEVDNRIQFSLAPYRAPVLDKVDSQTARFRTEKTDPFTHSAAGGRSYQAKVGGVEIDYRSFDDGQVSFKGYLRMDAEFTGPESVESMLETMRKMGLNTALSTEDDLRVTYYRTMQGHAGSAKDRASSLLLKEDAAGLNAEDRVQKRLSSFGRPATAKEEADAWAAEYEKIFPSLKGDNDYWRPIGSDKATNGHGSGGWAFWRRPTGDTPADLKDVWEDHVLQHAWFQDSDNLAQALKGTGQALATFDRRLRLGIYGTSKSADDDAIVGGARYLFTRIRRALDRGKSPNPLDASFNPSLIISPRAAYRVGTRNHSGDTFGALAKRGRAEDHLTKTRVEAIANISNSETAIAGNVSFYDDLEAITVPRESDRITIINALREAGMPDVIRGIRLEERVVVGNKGVEDFLKKHGDSVYGWQ